MQIAIEKEHGAYLLVNATIIEKHALQTGNPGSGSKNIRPYTVEYRGERMTVYDDEGDGRAIPGTDGPLVIGKYTQILNNA